MAGGGGLLTKPARVPSVRESWHVIAVQFTRFVDFQVGELQRSRSTSAEKIRRHRERNPDCAKSCCAGRRKPSAVPVLVSSPTPPQHGPPRGKTPMQPAPAGQDTAPVTSNPSPSRSLPEKAAAKGRKQERPKAAERERDPVKSLASFWASECKAAGVPSILEDWPALKSLIFATCHGHTDRARELVRPYIQDCGKKKQTPSVRDLLRFSNRPRGDGAAQLQISEEAAREHATPGRKELTV